VNHERLHQRAALDAVRIVVAKQVIEVEQRVEPELGRLRRELALEQTAIARGIVQTALLLDELREDREQLRRQL
jgi:hypothetical protein